MPRNSIATLDLPGPRPFSFSIREGKPFDLSVGFFTPPNASEWYWPLSGVFVQDELFLFTLVVHEEGGGSLGFGIGKTVVIHVKNPLDDDPFAWKSVTVDVPFTSAELQWAAATSYDEHAGMVYILGMRAQTDAVLARIRADDLVSDRLAAMEVLRSDGTFVHASPEAAPGMKMLFNGMVAETSLFWNGVLKQWYVLIIPPFMNQVKIRTASELAGPWSAERNIYAIPAPFVQHNNFAYAPKAHPELATSPNEIIWTYNSNALDSINPPTPIYIPQVIRTIISPS
jgi:hypothetical protein